MHANVIYIFFHACIYEKLSHHCNICRIEICRSDMGPSWGNSNSSYVFYSWRTGVIYRHQFVIWKFVLCISCIGVKQLTYDRVTSTHFYIIIFFFFYSRRKGVIYWYQIVTWKFGFSMTGIGGNSHITVTPVETFILFI